MATKVPTYLFRCSSDQSNGTNIPTLFAPASLSDHDISHGLTNPAASEIDDDFIALETPHADFHKNELGNQLRQALLWKKDLSRCPFLFFTTSPIFAIQLAAWRNARKTFKDGSVVEPDTNVRITIVNTETARTSTGQRVTFQSVSDLLRTHEVELRNRSDGSIRTYADHWVALCDVVPRKGSYHASLQDLVNNGFYEIYPQIQVANDRRDPRPSLTTDDLRKFFFSSGGGGSISMRETLDTAARVAMAFRPCYKDHEADEDEEIGVRLAFMLSLRKRNMEDLAVRSWLRDHTEQPSGTEQPGNSLDARFRESTISTRAIPDAAHFAGLVQHLSSLRFVTEGLAVGLSIDLDSIEKEKADWTRWWKQNRNEYRANHPREQRQGWQHRRKDRKTEILQRREIKGRRDSVVEAPRTPFPPTPRAPRPVELFPGWQRRAYNPRPVQSAGAFVGAGARTVHAGGHTGYHVLSSRPGDARTTRQQHRHARVVERRDQDGVYARRGWY